MNTKRAFAPKLKSKILIKWNRLSENDLDSIYGRFNLLSLKIQEVYEYSREKALQECNEFKNSNKLA
jgi:uncharacterized protein YjbJ (UPF0337 family)